jgi:PAS domain S-box-containing protein
MLDPSTSRGCLAVTHFLLGLTTPIVERLREWSKKLGLHEAHDTQPPVSNLRNSSTRERFDNQLRQIFDSIPALIHTTRPDGYIDYFNQNWLAYVGRSLEEIQGWKWTNSIHPDDVEGILQRWRLSLGTGEPFLFESRVRRADGVYRWMLHQKVPLRDEHGQIIKWYGSSIDIEDRKLAELSTIIDNAPVFLWSDLPDGYCDFLNQPWLTYFNLSLQEAQGAGWAKVIHPDDAADHLERWQKSVSTGIPFETEARYRRHDGEYRWFLNRANPLRDKTGRIVKWYGTNIDIDNLKRTEGKLRESEAYLAEAQRLSQTGSFGWKPDSGDIVWSDETYRIFAYDRAIKPTIDLVVQRVHPEDRPDFQNVVDRASAEKKHFEHAYRLLLDDGTVKHVHAIAHAFEDASGHCEFVGAVMDVTERKRAEEALQRLTGVRADASAAFATPGTLREMLLGCLEAIVRHLDAAFARIWTLNKDENMLELQASAGIYTRLDGAYSRIHVGDLKVGCIARERKPHLTNDVLNDPRVSNKEWARACGFVSFAGYPLIVEERVVGVMALFARHALSNATLDTLASVADAIAQGIERKRTEAILAGEKRILEMVAKGDSLEQILDALCRLVEEQAPGVLASVLLLERNLLRHGGGPSLPKAYTNAIDGAAIGPSAGSCGTAAYRGEQVIVADIETDPLWANYRDLALPHSLRACWSTPIFSSQHKVIGTFAMYYCEPRSPSPRDQDIIEQITQLAGVAIERKLTQEALHASALNLRHIVDGIPGLVFTLTADGEVEFVNQQILNYTGKTFEELKRWETTAPLIHPDDVQKVIAAKTRTLETGQPHSVEYRLRRADGAYRWFDLSRLAQRDSQGYVIRWYGLLSDIHERKQAARRDALLSLIVASSDDAIISKDLSGTITSWNRGAERIFGYTAEEMIGLSIFRIIPSERHAEEAVILSKLSRGERIEHYETIRRTKDGRLREISLTISPLLDEDGNVIGGSKIARDITEQKRAEQRLLTQHTITQILADAVTLEEATVKILRTICESLEWDVGALWSVDREAGVLRCVRIWHKESVQVPEFEEASRNATFIPGIGLPGRVWFRREPLYIPDVVWDSNFTRAPMVCRGILHAAFGFPILFGGDVLGVMEFFSHQIRQPDQELLDMMTTLGSQIGQFIERKRAEEAVRSAQTELAHVTRVATLGELTASIAHEVNQPLGAIVNNAGASLRWLAAQNMDEVRQSIEHVIKDGHRASDIISRIRALVRKAPPQKDWLDINETIGDVLSLTRTELDAHHVTLEKRLSVDAPTVMADRIQLQQVLLNIIMNAIEAMGGEGEGSRQLVIESKKDKARYVVITVQDSGPGIEPAHLDRLFDAFYSTKPRGLGMGLAISRSIIEAHGGRLWATANEPRGARFHFNLPIGGERTV